MSWMAWTTSHWRSPPTHGRALDTSTVQAAAPAPVKLRSGITLLPDAAAEDAARLPLTPDLKPMEQLDRTLCEIDARFGTARSEWVRMELEYPGRAGVRCQVVKLSSSSRVDRAAPGRTGPRG